MVCVALAVCILAPQIVLGQIQPQVGKTSGSSQITCPKISCHLHRFPAEHCKVQTFFVYHGVECKGCIEDICYGSKKVADSLIGQELIVESIHQDTTHTHSQNEHNTNNIPREWRRLNVLSPKRPDQVGPGSPMIKSPSQTIGQQNPDILSGGVKSIVASKKEITCPKIECELHHKPEEHCIVETYFLYHGNRCPGCIEDICLGAHDVPETLIGKNDTTALNGHAEIHDHGHIQKEHVDIVRSHGGGNNWNSNTETHNHRHIQTEHVDIVRSDRGGNNWNSNTDTHNHGNIPNQHVDAIRQNGGGNDWNSNAEIHNQGNNHQEQVSTVRGNRNGNTWGSNLQTSLQQRINNNNRGTFRNPFFRNRNTMVGNSQWNRPRSSADNFRSNTQPTMNINSNSRTNNGDNMSDSVNQRSSSGFQTRSESNNRNTEDVVVINQEPTSPAINNNRRGIRRFAGTARTYLQSLFHPTFSR